MQSPVLRLVFAVAAVVGIATAASLPTAAQAATIRLDPAISIAIEGTSFDVDLIVEGLGDAADPSLAVYDLRVDFDPNVIALGGVSFGSDIPNVLVQEVTPASGSVELLELSFAPVSAFGTQPGSFLLATLSFDALAPGTTALDLSGLAGDPLGAALTVNLQDGRAVVRPIPEPSSWILFGAGTLLVALALRGRARPD